jgi:response regulator RpfG family c-di-GMP phosphodiesterase
MAALKRIMIADDDEQFLSWLTDVLGRAGYHCDCVTSTNGIFKLLEAGDYGLLIADSEMPGNRSLEIFEKLTSVTDSLPIIITTDTPSLDTAVKSVDLRVAAYLMKPFDAGDLLTRIERCFQMQIKHHMQSNAEPLHNRNVLPNQQGYLELPVGTFVKLSFQHMITSLTDLQNLADALVKNEEREACQFLDCPRLASIRHSLLESIEVLERTKNSYKSKELADLRKKLEGLAENIAVDKFH